MVPGITERERRIADAQRLAWLTEAREGPAPRQLPRSTPSLVALWRRRVTPSPHALVSCLRRVVRERFAPAMAR